MILIAAAPGEILPQFPAPTHVFKGLLSRNIKVDNQNVCFLFLSILFLYLCTNNILSL